MSEITEAEMMAMSGPVATLRRPPWSELAEQSVIGALMLDNRAWDVVGDLLQPADFYSAQHAAIFDAISAMATACKPVDVLTLADKLTASGKLAAAGGLLYLSELSQCVASAANARRHAEIIREKAVLRGIILAADEVATQAFREDKQSDDLLGDVAAKFDALQAGRIHGTARSAGDLAVARIEAYTDRYEGLTPTGRSTGLAAIDRVLSGGLNDGRVYVLAARPSVGKTAFALQIARHRAEQGDGVLVLSLEMPAEECQDRMYAAAARIDYGRLQGDKFTDDDWTRLSEAAEGFAGMNLHIDDQGGLTLRQIRAKAMAMRRRGLKLLVIDYVQLCAGMGQKGATRSAEIGEISRGLKALAKQLRISILLLSQLNREVEKRAVQEPTLADLRDSGEIEQDADVVLFLWPVRPLGDSQIVGATFGKNRQGKRGVRVPLEFVGAHQRFFDSHADITPQAMQRGKTSDFE